MTLEVKSIIENSDCVAYLLNEPAIAYWVKKHAKKSIDLENLYFEHDLRENAYHYIAQAVLDRLEAYSEVCFLTYGHPTFLTTVTTEIKSLIANINHVTLHVLPGVSAIDCLFADLQLDPGDLGLQSYEATHFILNEQEYSSSAHLILWQVASIGNLKIIDQELNTTTRQNFLKILTEKLLKKYDPEHEVFAYVASQYPGITYDLIPVKLNVLCFSDVPRLSLLYIPPNKPKVLNQDVMSYLDNE